MKLINKTNILICLLIFNLTLLLVTAVIINNTNNKVEKLPDYLNHGEIDIDDYIKKYTVKIVEKNLTHSYKLETETNFTNDDKEVIDYKVDSVNQNFVGKILSENELIGKSGEEDILAQKSGKIVGISLDDEKYTISVYGITSFEIFGYINQELYYSIDLKSMEKDSYLLLADSSKLPVSFIGVDYEYGVKNGKIKLIYRAKDENCVMIVGTKFELRIDYKKLNKVLTVEPDPYCPFPRDYKTVLTYKQSFVDGKTSYKEVELTILDQEGKDFIVKGDGLYDGQILYIFR